ncbi:hypothetical protein [Pantoea ananatis]|uniref:hypothetical protein n=1 Tax=Pantoea ananas TaxID=553 RepID=UPI001F4DD689|nr:hypothetical protein [Pantoea ananatis]MCH9269674.1 hypothetical protein [Pantoea ananatis]
MSDLEKKIDSLMDSIEELQLDAHASRVAIATLATAMKAIIGEDSNLGEMYLTAISQVDPVEFDNPVEDGYREKLNEKVAALLGKIN